MIAHKDSPFYSAWQKLEWASKHLKNLDREIKVFLGSKPYTIIPHGELGTGDIVYFFRSRKTIPIEIRLLAGDVVHNIRSSLDHVAHTVFERYPNGSKNHYQFPIISNEQFRNGKLTKEIEKVCPIDSKEGVLFQTLCPYEGGNQNIWLTHRLDIYDKHKLLIQAFFKSMKTSEVNISVRDSVTGKELEVPDVSQTGFTSHYFNGGPLNDNAEIHRIRRLSIHTDGVDMHPEFFIDIAFAEPAELNGINVVDALDKFGNTARQTILAFEDQS